MRRAGQAAASASPLPPSCAAKRRASPGSARSSWALMASTSSLSRRWGQARRAGAAGWGPAGMPPSCTAVRHLRAARSRPSTRPSDPPRPLEITPAPVRVELGGKDAVVHRQRPAAGGQQAAQAVLRARARPNLAQQLHKLAVRLQAGSAWAHSVYVVKWLQCNVPGSARPPAVWLVTSSARAAAPAPTWRDRKQRQRQRQQCSR